MSRTQTIDHKHTHKEKDTKIYKVRLDAYISEAEEREMVIYTRYKRIIISSLKNSHQKSLTLKMGNILCL